ncbi:iron-enterobactin transporter subunit; membrane component of ABC superfamily [Nostocoides japonicum T1-X7]|uniref:Iron-enterobactin transporter subunit membrane component of ABC superfamily n=1 Tax=Nostocoides japonicum T1-X7 TaxID=1194083 RepID=A0A077LWM4_9MICO|nr:iron chelate uptake ABC transporter family permease subunit [Tetrasphaera japonica]CCH78328.1 iron-enterobactin transporter subunit; membrane component of ABC superfamily [Tetrasphaera japonica T1-X7]
MTATSARPVSRVGASRSRRHVLWHVGGLSLRFERRAAWTYAVLTLFVCGLGLFALTLGDYGVDVPQVVAALLGRADDPLAQYFVTDVRAPRIVAALLVGAALGVSGAIFQTISGNPLGSPDVIGFSTGAATGALVAIIVGGASPSGVAVGAVLGGIAAAAAVYLLAWRGGVAGFRLVLVGIGVAAALRAVNALLVVKAPLDAAQAAEQWLAGSLNGASWSKLSWLGAALLVLTPITVGLFRGLAMLPLGDELAGGLGVRVQRLRLLVVLVGVALVALATAAAGPVAFVALAAPHLVRRLTRTGGIALAGAALMGAALTLASDVIAQRIFAPTQLAVGVVTGSLGGCYLIVLLALEWRRHRG